MCSEIVAMEDKGRNWDKLLSWECQVNLIGETVTNPQIFACDVCSNPILIYGRMIPCKHVFCYDCANAICKTEKLCPRCNEDVQRLESCKLGDIFMCTHGGPMHNSKLSCRRTYLSQRDLDSHIDHRHVPKGALMEPSLDTVPTPRAYNNNVPSVSGPRRPVSDSSRVIAPPQVPTMPTTTGVIRHMPLSQMSVHSMVVSQQQKIPLLDAPYATATTLGQHGMSLQQGPSHRMPSPIYVAPPMTSNMTHPDLPISFPPPPQERQPPAPTNNNLITIPLRNPEPNFFPHRGFPPPPGRGRGRPGLF